MAGNKIQAGNLTRRGRGRPKGSVNKTTRQAKEVIQAVAEGLGGIERVIAWAQEDPKNESAFWTGMFTKLVPLEVNGTHHVETVDRTELLREAEERVRAVFGGQPAFGAGDYGGGLPN